MARAPITIFRTAQALRLAGTSLLLALAGCTVAFTPGDAKPAIYTPYPSGGASSGGSSDSPRGGPSM